MKQTLKFDIAIKAPKKRVWETMLGKETYTAWTEPFCAGSSFTGSWDKGAKIKFTAPSGDGMLSEIAENKLHEFVSIRHLGEISQGVEDTTSEKVLSWAPAYENYEFAESGGITTVKVSVDIVPEYLDYMNETFPKALAKLKEMSER